MSFKFNILEIYSCFLDVQVQPNNYVNFSDDQQRSWSVMIDAAPYVELVTQVMNKVAYYSNFFTSFLIILSV